MLEGTMVRLRALEMGDLERDYLWVNDREVTRFISMRYPMSRAEEERWLRDRPGNGYAAGVVLAIETKDGVHIGNLGLHEVNADDRKAALGIVIGDKSYWSNGYGTDAIVTLLRFGFGEMNLHRVLLHVIEFNERAIACYRKCGFQEEGRLRQHRFSQGRYWDVLVMGVLRDEFDALHGIAAQAAGTS
ncbi:MAG: GNAT family N-acetyltransferase [Chloroflexi bacterium]|nr:GNAT family N-acetyltransferase [Chloroflexota bacterium]